MNDDRDRDKQSDGDALWSAMTRDVKPIKREVRSISVEKKKPEKQQSKTKQKISRAQIPATKQIKESVSKQSAGAGLDRRTSEKLRKGQMPIEARLDLHGMTQNEAHEALSRFIVGAQAAGKRCVIVITGKGAGVDGRRDPLSSGQGVLKRKVPEWLDEGALKPLVLKTHPARPQHGGEGALYVLLRKKR